MHPLVSVMVFEDNFEYWSERDLKGIPRSFRKRIGRSKTARIPYPDRMFEPIGKFVENLSNRKKFSNA